MAAIDNENTTETPTADKITLSDTVEEAGGRASRILLLHPDGLVSPALIDDSGIVRELQPTEDLHAAVLTDNDDILQQAFQEAGTDYVDESDPVTNATEDQMNAAESDTISYVTNEDGQIINSVIESTFMGEDGNQYAILRSQEDGSQVVVLTHQVEDTDTELQDTETETVQLVDDPQEPDQPETFQQTDQPQTFQQVPESLQNGETDTTIPIQTIETNTQEELPNEKPLGSSENPIRIIQQGNQYTSLQHLTPEQLQHIMQVLQQQQVVKPTPKQGSTTLYSPQTNTKIVYRVIYPGERKEVLMKAKNKFPLTNFPGRGRGQSRGKVIPGTRGRGRPRKFPINVDENDINQFPDLSKEEKDRRKKMRPRTRSGRVSKPPKHMVKDYKQIHLVDWAEDYDDSDGGYSDFHPSHDENEDCDDGESIGADENGLRKFRGFKCEVCSKSYIGQGSLNRHYRLNPSHGTPIDDGRSVPNDAMNEESNFSSASVPGSRYKRIFRRGKLPQRLNNLREAVKHFTNEELMEIVLPRLTQCMTTWEFMLMKSERPEPGGTSLRPSIPGMLREYESLLKDVREYTGERLSQVDTEPVEKENAIKIDHAGVASSLCLQPSVWHVVTRDEIPYIPMKYKFSKAASNFMEKIEELNNEGVDCEQPLAKRVRIDGASRSVAAERKVTHVRSLLTNQITSTDQVITLSPNDMRGQGQSQGQIHGQIVLEKGSDEPTTSLISLNATNKVPGSLHVSDLISIRAGDEDDLIMADTGGEVGDVTHPPEAMLQQAEANHTDSDVIVIQPNGYTAQPSDVIVTQSNRYSTQTSDVTGTQSNRHSTQTNDVTGTQSNRHSTQTRTQSNAPTSQTNASPMMDTQTAETQEPGQNSASKYSCVVGQADDENGGGDAADSVFIMQTEDGMLLIQKPDGSTLQVEHSGEGLTMETVQYLLSMDTSQIQGETTTNSTPDEQLTYEPSDKTTIAQ